ncbi:MAG TPA: class I SAM-dependent DNA methyltransferase, partial [Candidatus Competibacteraceae bacterium]|nr:class I SAM-dependent DNA methyltransferase [Candidatus Competibacteraceae bacterium]HSA45828.1 class I SAM-dependent DNA methyltransferase [Candidatus Competibacteraceae bacterium]
RAQIEAGQAQRAGLVATNSIRGGQNRKVLERIRETGAIFNAWSDLEWVNEGAAVRVSLVGFGTATSPMILDGQPVMAIYADLTGQSFDDGVDLTQALSLTENAGVSCYGSQQKGQFEIEGGDARRLLAYPNPHGKPNSEVIKRAINAKQVMDRPHDDWVIDFGLFMPEDQAMLYEGPYEIITTQVKPARLAGRDQSQKRRWWLHARPSPVYRRAQQGLSRCIATPAVAKYRLFIWLDSNILADHALIVFARSDDTTFGILHSRFHELWALRTCTWLGKGNDPRYTPTTCFETFPFPKGASFEAHAQAIAVAARKLNELRENWLNPPQWVDRVPEVVPGYPDRLIPKPEHAAELKKRTLTNLYNQRPTWLDHAHRTLDQAVAAAYGWPADLSDDEVLRRLLALNRERTLTGEIQ